ncbi:MAG: YebC/PmpR family DNA-binding transcriptional regulator [Armatimonadetes bacterium]|nr:YebC/PmpR family DNA-binding transcriptional regulator [Armatimonadota bacterium]
MAGHSKWANRVHRKSRQDAKRSKLFGKLSRQIIVAARQGGPDPDKNIRLRLAIEAARAASMPADNIERAIKRGSGQLEGVAYEEATLEGYGPGGAALMIDILTDNRQRTLAEIRHIMRTADASLGEAGCVTWLFEQKGIVVVPRQGNDEETVFLAAADAGAEDIAEEEDYWEIRTSPQDFQQVLDALREAGIEPERAEVTMVPTTTTQVPDDQAPKLLRLLDALEDHDDVQHVYSNFEISDEILDQLEGED